MAEQDDEMNENVWRVLSKSGPIAIVAGALLWVFIYDVRADHRATRAEHAEQRAEANENAIRTQNILDQISDAQDRTVYLQRQQCYNTARTDEQRRACAKDRD